MNLSTSYILSKILWVGLLFSLPMSLGSARAQDRGMSDHIAAPSSFNRLIDAGRDVGWTALRGVATADYRGFDLKDMLPIEQVYLPRIAAPIERHPSLLFHQEQVGLIRDRIHREPYATWWRVIRQRAEAGLMQDLSDPGLGEFQRATASKACAFAFVISGDSLFLEKARQGLLHISPPPAVTTPEGGERGRGWGDWIRASALMLTYCVAYDLVARDLSPEESLSVARKLAAEADQLYRNLKFSPPNNHKTIMAVAVGSAALTIPSYGSGQPQAWLDAAMTDLRSGLAQIDGDGTYREGAFYGSYISRLLFPFAFYLQRTTDYDLFRHRRLEDLAQWLIRIGRPDGSIPLVDDAWKIRHAYLPMLVGQSRLGGVARWIYEKAPERTSEYLMEVEFICAFDHRVAPQPPPWERTAFFPDGGMAVFGDNWSSTGTYLLLQAEGTENLTSGHEHLD
ncbi:hypothetical protein ACFL0G_03370, partial [Candidatus Zixiibacteriota bacterium]